MSELLTTRDLQDLLKVDRITIYRMLHEGYLPGFKIGGQWRFSRDEIDSWLEAQRDFLPEAPGTSAPFTPSVEALPLHCIEVMQDVFAEVLGIAVVTCDTVGHPLAAVSNCGAFCSLVLSTAEGRRRCERSWRPSDGCASCVELRRCHAGLLSGCARIRVGDAWVASVAGCQFVPQKGDGSGRELDISALAAALGLAEGDLRGAAADVRRLQPGLISRMPGLLSRLAETFSEIGEERLALLGRLQRIAEMTKV